MCFYHSRKLHLKSSRSSNSLQKPHTEPILCSDCIPIVVFDNPEEDNCSNTIDALSARLDSATVHYTTQNDFLGFPVPLFICEHFLSVKNRFRRSNLQKNEKYQGFFVLKPREYRSFRRSIEGRKTGWWWWPLTSYCDVKKRISAVSPAKTAVLLRSRPFNECMNAPDELWDDRKSITNFHCLQLTSWFPPTIPIAL